MIFVKEATLDLFYIVIEQKHILKNKEYLQALELCPKFCSVTIYHFLPINNQAIACGTKTAYITWAVVSTCRRTPATAAGSRAHGTRLRDVGYNH